MVMIFYDKMADDERKRTTAGEGFVVGTDIQNGIITYKKDKIDVFYDTNEKANFYDNCMSNIENVAVSIWSDTPRSVSELSDMARGLE